MSDVEGAEFEINFTDLTLLEANGEYEEVDKIMKKPQKVVGQIYAPIPDDKWVVKSEVTIKHGFGFAQVSCDFYHDGKVIITAFSPSSKDLYCIDIRCLSAWALQYGWKTPEPIYYIVEDWQEFWMLQWETHIIDCDYFDKKIGPRGQDIFSEEDDIHEDADDIDDNLYDIRIDIDEE